VTVEINLLTNKEKIQKML